MGFQSDLISNYTYRLPSQQFKILLHKFLKIVESYCFEEIKMPFLWTHRITRRKRPTLVNLCSGSSKLKLYPRVPIWQCTLRGHTDSPPHTRPENKHKRGWCEYMHFFHALSPLSAWMLMKNNNNKKTKIQALGGERKWEVWKKNFQTIDVHYI